MRKVFALFMIFVFVLSVGCAPQAEQEEVTSIPSPDLGQVEHKDAEKVAPPETKTAEEESKAGTKTTSEYTASEPEEELGTLGSRVTGTQQEAVEQTSPEGEVEIALYSNKTMSMSSLTVSAGTAVYWKNYDSWPHQLAVETGKGFDTKRHALSDRILEGGVWKYTFKDKGTFLVRDIFSGAMRMTVTVE